VLLVSLGACSNEDGEVGNIIDRTIWDMRGYPSQQEILDHLQEKYGKEFGLISLNPGARFFQGVAYPLSNQDLAFSLEMHDSEGDPLPLEELRDDYQARLAEQYISGKIRPVLESQFGSEEIASLRVEVALFDRLEEATLPASFEWTPADGMNRLADEEAVTIHFNINLMFETATSLESLTDADLEKLIEALTIDADIPLGGTMELRASNAGATDALIHLGWEVSDNTLHEFEITRD